MKTKKLQAAIERDRAAEQLAHDMLRQNGFGAAVDAIERRGASAGIDTRAVPRGFKAAQKGSADAIAQTFGFVSVDEVHGGRELAEAHEREVAAGKYYGARGVR